MAARDFTKKELFLFYTNVAVIVFALVYANASLSSDPVVMMSRKMAHSSVSQGMLTLAAGGILLSLMGAHFCKGWNILYMVLQILCILGILIALCVVVGVNAFMPSQMGDITDPDTLEGLKNATDYMKGFLDRNEDFRGLYASAEKALSFCGFYDKKDALGVGCPYSDQDVCAVTDTTFLSLLLTTVKTVFAVLSKNLVMLIIVEIVIFIILVIAYKSVTKPNVIKRAEYSLSPTNPVSDNRASLLRGQEAIPGMPSTVNSEVYYAQPVNSQPAKPVNAIHSAV